VACDKAQVEAWIDEARAGSSAALGQLLEMCRQYLFDVARRRVSTELKSKVSVSDLVQETSLDAHRDFANFRGECLEELLAWLRQILLFNAANIRRRYENTAKRRVSREMPLALFPGIAEELQDDALSPRSLVANAEERLSIEQALMRLSPDHRTVIVLRSREHLSFAEVGARMDRTSEAARKLWFRAVERLEHELNRDR
jgi:RNA polymerase sigma-70 factor (ECF subfamily)